MVVESTAPTSDNMFANLLADNNMLAKENECWQGVST